jgi:hypothetical protein
MTYSTSYHLVTKLWIMVCVCTRNWHEMAQTQKATPRIQKAATRTPMVAYMAKHQRATPLNHTPCHAVQGSTWHHSHQWRAVQNTPPWHPHVPNVQWDGHHPSPRDVMPGSTWHLALDTFPDCTHAKHRTAARTFHVAFILRTAHLAAATTQCHYWVTWFTSPFGNTRHWICRTTSTSRGTHAGERTGGVNEPRCTVIISTCWTGPGPRNIKTWGDEGRWQWDGQLGMVIEVSGGSRHLKLMYRDLMCGRSCVVWNCCTYVWRWIKEFKGKIPPGAWTIVSCECCVFR